MSGMFQSLSMFNYRLWFIGALASNIGIWMHRTAQDWLVLTELTDFDAVALGYMSALHFVPSLILMPVTGMISDRFDKRHVLIVAQALQGLLAITLATMTLLGVAEMWHMYIFAGALGLLTAFDQPARQTIVGFLVDDRSLNNAVALNMTSMHGARLVGPAVAGITVAAVGAGWAFVVNAIAIGCLLVALFSMRESEMRPHVAASARPKDFFMGFAYIAKRPDLRALFLMMTVFGLIAFNFGFSVTTLTAVAYDGDAFQLGLVSTGSALGGLIGSLLVARLAAPRWRVMAVAPLFYGAAWALAVAMPSFWWFVAIMPLAGLASQLLSITANTYAQVATEPSMRGRVIALYQGVQTGAAPFGAVMLGWLVAHFGPQWAIGAATALAGLIIGAIGFVFVLRSHRLRIHRTGWRGFSVELEPRA